MKRAELLKTAKPILFNTDMVRAIWDGRKTETRRVIKLKYDNTHIEICNNKYGKSVIELQNQVEGETFGINPDGTHFQKLLGAVDKHPPYKPGDILYVRETWQKQRVKRPKKAIPADFKEIEYLYRADGEIANSTGEKFKWRPSIHMPKEAARIFLRVTDVRVERLQDITISGIKAEGVIPKSVTGGQWQQLQDEYFKPVWNSTIPKKDRDIYGWDANPWVWVIEFERIEVEA